MMKKYINTIMIVLDGQLYIQQEDYWGNRNMLDILHTVIHLARPIFPHAVVL